MTKTRIPSKVRYLGKGEILWNKMRIRLRGKDRQKIQKAKIGETVDVDIVIDARLKALPVAKIPRKPSR